MNIYTILGGYYHDGQEFIMNTTNKKEVFSFIKNYDFSFDGLEIIKFNTTKNKIMFRHFLLNNEIKLFQQKKENSFYDYEVKKEEILSYCKERNIILEEEKNKLIVFFKPCVGQMLDLKFFKKHNFSVLEYIKEYKI